MTRLQLSSLTSGYLISDTDFDDYGIKAGERIKIKTTEYGGVIFPHHGDEIRLNNNEIRDDMLGHLTHID